ncbi:MAG: thiopurine S-methyltransferase [Steroidobacteraceae bacterium]
MKSEFWHDRWTTNQIGFHEPEAHPLLTGHIDALALPPASRVFLPLCGMTVDIDWLLSRGYRVAGAELSELAAQRLFERLRVTPVVTQVGTLRRFSAPNLDLFVGDIFELSPQMLGPIDAVYDRAALIALPAEMRQRYVPHVVSLTNGRPQLVIGLGYDQALMNGPPFAVGADEVRRLYTEAGGPPPELLVTREVPGGLKGRLPATEQAWLIR